MSCILSQLADKAGPLELDIQQVVLGERALDSLGYLLSKV